MNHRLDGHLLDDAFDYVKFIATDNDLLAFVQVSKSLKLWFDSRTRASMQQIRPGKEIDISNELTYLLRLFRHQFRQGNA